RNATWLWSMITCTASFSKGASSRPMRQRCKCCKNPTERPRHHRTCGSTAPDGTARRLCCSIINKLGPDNIRWSSYPVTLVGCWAHARRGFVEALAVLPKEERTSGTSATAKGLAYCNRLFEIERELKELSPEERKAERLARSVPVLHEFHAWLTKQSTIMLPKSAFGKAVTYCLNQWD